MFSFVKRFQAGHKPGTGGGGQFVAAGAGDAFAREAQRMRTLMRSKQRLPPSRSLRAISQTLGLWHDAEMTPQRLRQEIEEHPAHAPLTSAAIAAALGIEKWGSQCREIRGLIPWRDIERRLVE